MNDYHSERDEEAKDEPYVSRRALGNEAFLAGDWATAAREFDEAIRNSESERQTWLRAATAHERSGNKTLSASYTSFANRIHPATSYDSSSAFGVYAGAPAERDEIAQFLVENMILLRSRANRNLDSVQAVSTPRVFVYWDTEARPDVVARCIDSMHRFSPDNLQVVELNASTLSDWITIDKEILAGIESTANISDIIRLHLLATHGGLWLDATCLLNQGFPYLFDQISREDFFLYTYRGSRTGSWFFWATPDSYRLQLLRAALDTWLEAGRRWSNYFMFHDFVEMLYWTDARYKNEWDVGLYMHPREALEMNKALGRRVSKEEWFDLRRRSPVNKLTWKFDSTKLNDPNTGIARLLAEDVRTAFPKKMEL